MNRRAYTVAEVHAMTGLHPNTIRQKIRNGELRAKRWGRQYLIDSRQIDEILDFDEPEVTVQRDWDFEKSLERALEEIG